MKQKKEVSIWYAAATFYLTAGFIVPLVAAFIYGFLVSSFMAEGILDTVLSIIFSVISIWLGVMYAARYIRKAYIIKDRKKLINLATTYLVVCWIAINLFAGTFGPGSIVLLIAFVIRVAMFYFLSRVYVKQDIEAESTTQPRVFN
jgi:hypothetical protein